MGHPRNRLPPKLRALANKLSPAPRKQTGPSQHEMAFDRTWLVLLGPSLQREQVLITGRSFRFDRSHAAAKVAIELHGAIWAQGRHTRGRGFMNDRIKVNSAIMIGWVVFELTPEMITPPNLVQIRDFIRGRIGETVEPL